MVAAQLGLFALVLGGMDRFSPSSPILSPYSIDPLGVDSRLRYDSFLDRTLGLRIWF
jgi:hypothetical protein